MDERDWDVIWADIDELGRPDPLISEWAGAPGRSIDLGCGIGENVLTLAAAGWDAHGVDSSRAAIATATRAAAARSSGARFAVADLEEGVPGSNFDLVTMFYVHLDHEHQSHLLASVAGALNPSGRFLYVGHDKDFVSTHHGTMGDLTHHHSDDPKHHRDEAQSADGLWEGKETGDPERIASLVIGLNIERAQTLKRRIFHGPQEIDTTDVIVMASKD